MFNLGIVNGAKVGLKLRLAIGLDFRIIMEFLRIFNLRLIWAMIYLILFILGVTTYYLLLIDCRDNFSWPEFFNDVSSACLQTTDHQEDQTAQLMSHVKGKGKLI